MQIHLSSGETPTLHALAPLRVLRAFAVSSLYVLRFTHYESSFLTGFALLYSNGLAWWAHRRGHVPEEAFRRVNLGVLGLMVGYAAVRKGGLHRVGIRREGLRAALLGGVATGLGLSGPPLFFLYKPVLLDTPLEYGPISGMTRREMLLDIFLRVPVSIALFEELLFRGLLFSSLRARYSAPAAIALSSAAFAGWHFAVTYTSAAQSNLSTAARLPRLLRPFVLPLAVLGGMLSTGLAGVAFGLLSEGTGNLAGPIVAHWVVDGLVIAALSRRPR